MESALTGDEPVGFAWIVLLAFLRLSTLPAVSPEPLGIDVAFELVGEWLAQRPATIVQPTNRHVAILADLLTGSGVGGNLVSDAHLAALALEHGARLCTFDRDFGRFAGLRTITPD